MKRLQALTDLGDGFTVEEVPTGRYIRLGPFVIDRHGISIYDYDIARQLSRCQPGAQGNQHTEP